MSVCAAATIAPVLAGSLVGTRFEQTAQQLAPLGRLVAGSKADRLCRQSTDEADSSCDEQRAPHLQNRIVGRRQALKRRAQRNNRLHARREFISFVVVNVVVVVVVVPTHFGEWRLAVGGQREQRRAQRPHVALRARQPIGARATLAHTHLLRQATVNTLGRRPFAEQRLVDGHAAMIGGA